MKTTFYQCLHGANFHAYIPFVCSLLSFYCFAHIFAFTRSQQRSKANRAHGMSTRWPRRVHLAPTVVVLLVVGVLSKFSTFLLLSACLPNTRESNNNNNKHSQLAAAWQGGAGKRGTNVACVGLMK